MPMMTVKEYAAKIGAPVSTIRQMCADAVLPSVKVGVGYRIFEDKADVFFEKCWEARREKKESCQRREVFRKNTKRKSVGSSDDFIAKLKAMRDGLSAGSGGA